ncbi:MAG: hypothetical protein AABW75_02930 [Nanoarchaeota archaeon]
MGILEEIRKMQQEGHTEQDIIDSLAERGVPYSEINNSLSQTKIKNAVNAPSVVEDSSSIMPQEPPMTQIMSQSQGMQPSVLATETQEAKRAKQQSQQAAQQAEQSQEAQQPQQEFASSSYPEEQQQPNYNQQEYSQYPVYQQYGAEADAISEIAEQVLIEKISPLKNKIEAVLDLKSVFEAKINFIDERLKRIEKIIDRLELSILQKVGSYVQNVEDIKSELVETQKSFKSLLNSKGLSASLNAKEDYKEI